MPDTMTTVLKQILAAAVGLEGPAMWQAIDQAADEIGRDEALRNGARAAAGYAHLACFPGDGRQLLPAIRKFRDAKRFDVIRDILDTALAFGEASAVQEIRRIGLLNGVASLAVPDFGAWYRQKGVRWFDVYEDPDEHLTFIDPQDIAAMKMTAAQEHPEQTTFWKAAAGMADADPGYPPVRRALLKAIAEGKQAIVPTPPNKRADANRSFRAYAEANGIRILRQLASGLDGLRRCSDVYLALDQDGITKVYKEILTHEEERIGNLIDTEDKIFEALKGLPDIPKVYGTLELPNGTRFLIRSYARGQLLTDYAYPGKLLTKQDACEVVCRLAEALGRLHDKGVLYLDLRPDNVLLDERGATLFDFNASRHDPSACAGSREAVAYVLDPKFAPPETTLRCRATAASDVFQLGLLFHQLLYGKLPFVTLDELGHGDGQREQAILKFALANALLPYAHRPDKDFGDPHLKIIRRMLAKKPEDRPTAEEVAEKLWTPLRDIKLRGRAAGNKREKNTVIFPARMGIPHRGHIDYISRLLDLGYHVKISLQRSYTITDRDPLPKWIVLKMVAQSLMDRGFDPSAFSFMLTPYFEDDLRHRLHFSMLPGRDDLVAVASSNPDVPALFPGLPVLDQKAIFGEPGAAYEDRSWGESIRQAVKSGDYAIFSGLAASGIGKIMTFAELQAHYAERPIEFVPGSVKVSVLGLDGKTRTARVGAYDLPEETAAHAIGATILDPYAEETLIASDRGERLTLAYDSTFFRDGNETIRFEIVRE